MSATFTLVGRGRAGGSIAIALEAVGWQLVRTYGRSDDPFDAAMGVDLCVIATPDAMIAAVAHAIQPAEAVVLHLSGVSGLDVLGAHRAAALHPLVALPEETAGAEALRTAWFAVGGDPLARDLADQLSGRWFPIADDDRTLYHAAAVVASNHLVALLGHLERIAAEIDVPVEAFLRLARGSLDDVVRLGSADALTGPARRGDEATLDAHRRSLAERLPAELPTYDALLAEARRLADTAD